MFSSLSSFLPSALHINVPDKGERTAVFTQDDDDDGDGDEHKREGEGEEREDSERGRDREQEGRKKGKKDRANETFIVVRPPPSKSNHPLNLQVQLVPPNAKPPTGIVATPTTARASFESTATTPTTADPTTFTNDLSRSTSHTSTATTASYQTSHRTSSTASFSSFTSSTASTTRRTIIPLYNLQAHNVLTNVVVDAGTDAKIARFQKRGIEMMDMAVIEPVEVWGDPNAREKRGSVDEMGVMPGNGKTKEIIGGIQDSAASSAVSLSSAGHSGLGVAVPQPAATTPTLPTIPQTPPASSGGVGKRNIFGKLFKKNKDVISPPSSAPPSPSIAIFSSSPTPQQETHTPTQKRPVSANVDPNVTPTNSPHTSFGGAKGHGRNLSLTNGLSPLSGLNLKATLKNNKNRLSAALDATGLVADVRGPRTSSSSSRLSTTPTPDDNTTGGPVNERKRSPSPNPSALSRSTTTNSNSLENAPAGALSLAPTQTQMESIREKEKQERLQLRPPILGIQPTYVSSNTQPAPRGNVSLRGERALMYVWLVRRWLKKREGEEGGLLGALGAVHLGAGVPALGNLHTQHQGGMVPGGLGGVEVRFEWKRARGKKRDSGDEKDKLGSTRSRRRGSSRRRRAREVDDDSEERERKKKNRLSGQSFATNITSEEGGCADDGEESDPEDSETPWVCTLKIRRSNPVPVKSSSRPSSAHGPPVPSSPLPQQVQGGGAQVVRVKVGTLSPTPHHPKVVAMLKVPFPLPDVEVERMGVVKRKGVGSSVGGKIVAGVEAQQTQQYGTPAPYHGITLTAEEIKDIVCCTGLWLIVREGFGGVGKVNRKGDGWRIRG